MEEYLVYIPLLLIIAILFFMIKHLSNKIEELKNSQTAEIEIARKENRTTAFNIINQVRHTHQCLENKIQKLDLNNFN